MKGTITDWKEFEPMKICKKEALKLVEQKKKKGETSNSVGFEPQFLHGVQGSKFQATSEESKLGDGGQ